MQGAVRRANLYVDESCLSENSCFECMLNRVDVAVCICLHISAWTTGFVFRLRIFDKNEAEMAYCVAAEEMGHYESAHLIHDIVCYSFCTWVSG